GIARVAVRRRVIGAQRVHEIDDRDGRAVVGDGDPRIAPEGLTGVFVLLEPARLEHELAPAPGVRGQVHVHGLPFAVGRARERIEEARPDRLFLAVLHQLHHELDARLVVALGRDAGGEAEVRAFRDVDGETVTAGRGRVQGRADDVVDADALAGLAFHPGRVTAPDVGLDARGARAEKVEGPGRGRAGGA